MLEVIGISKQYLSGRGHVQALTGISFQMEKGTNLALVGKSGSGKTTLMNCIGGIEKPDTGKVVIDGQEIQSLSERALCLFQRQHIGFVFQHGNLLSFLTAAENIAFPLNLNGVDARTRNRRVCGTARTDRSARHRGGHALRTFRGRTAAGGRGPCRLP